MIEGQELQNITVEKDRIIYSLDENQKIANIIGCTINENEIIIPYSITHNSTEYVVMSLAKESFAKSKIKSIKFDTNSKVKSIEENAFYLSSIEELSIPSSLIDLKKGWCLSTPKLYTILISPNNPKYSYFDNKYIIGKSSMYTDEYDDLVFCSRNVENVLIPSFIKHIRSCAFSSCKMLTKISISPDSKLQSIESDVIKDSLIEDLLEIEINRCLQNPLKRQAYTNSVIYFGKETYMFQNYNKVGILYQCKYGRNRHKKNRCKAQILAPYNTMLFGQWKGSIHVINSVHTYHPEIREAIAPYFSEYQLSEQIEKIYFSETPRIKRHEAFNMLLKFIKENTPKNIPLTKVTDTFFNKIYNRIERENRKKDEIVKNLRSENFELFTISYSIDNFETPTYIKCYASPFQISMISKCSIIGIDGTFQSAPKSFAQVIVFMGNTDKINIPIAYFLLPSRKEIIYKIAFSTFKSFVNNFKENTTFISDFEQAEINAIKNELVQNKFNFQLCFFHYVKAIKGFFQKELADFTYSEQAKKNQNNDENSDYNIDIGINIKKEINRKVKKCAKIFPFIKHEKVYQCIEVLKEYNQTSKFADYFKSTYLTRFNINDWSVYGKNQSSIITNNMVERHNRKLNESFRGAHPTLEGFVNEIAILENHYFDRYANAPLRPESQINHYDENDFDAAFNDLKNFLCNHGKQKQRATLSSIQKEQHQDLNGISKIKDLPAQDLKYLKKACRNFFSFELHSQEKRKILEDAEKRINNENIALSKIRKWFNNNKENYINYIPSDDQTDEGDQVDPVPIDHS